MMTGLLRSSDPDRLRAGYGVKWGSLPTGTIGAWVADMDLGIPPAVKQALAETIDREDFGYPFWRDGDPVVEAFTRRMTRRFGWAPAPDRTRMFTDLIQVLQVVIEHTTKRGDGIALHVPAYPPFLASVARSGRRAVPIPMRLGTDGWGFDTDNLTDRLRTANCRLLLVVVNPHNPTGRVFTEAELDPLAQLAEELDLAVLSDEVHADLTFSPARHIPFGSLGEDTANRTITATSATKAFNIAGLRLAVAHIGSAQLRTGLDQQPLDYFGQPSTLSRLATVAAWNDSDDWLTELLRVLARNRDQITTWTHATLGIRSYRPPQATHLAWLDLGERLEHPTPARHLEQVARVKLSEGAEFSETTDFDTTSFVRINFATDSPTLTEILRRVGNALLLEGNR